MLETVITAGGLSMLLLEGVKYLIRLFKGQEFSFPAKFYLVALPVLNVLVIPALAWLGMGGFVMPTDWMLWAKDALIVLLASLVSVGGYENTLAPFKAYREELKYLG